MPVVNQHAVDPDGVDTVGACGFQRGARDVAGPGAAGEAAEETARLGAPVRRAQPDEAGLARLALWRTLALA